MKVQWWKNMRLIDTNVILRYCLEDNREMLAEAEKIIDEGAFTIPEVLAEVVYVLIKVYGIERSEVCDTLNNLLEDVDVADKSSMLEAISVFRNTSLDFVDCIIIGRNHILGEEVFSFDKKLNKHLR